MEATLENFDAALQQFLEMIQLRINAYYLQYQNLTPSVVSMSRGRRYVKIIETTNGGNGQRSVHSFVDCSPEHFGDIYKPATWTAPAKHARGNIFSDSNGSEALSVAASIRYLS